MGTTKSVDDEKQRKLESDCEYHAFKVLISYFICSCPMFKTKYIALDIKFFAYQELL